jgi:hypothetical protein
LGAPLDVTCNNAMVAARPLTIAIGLGSQYGRAAIERRQASLSFREAGRERRVLGKILLRMTDSIPLGNEILCLFETRGSKNYCAPQPRLWIRYLELAYRKWRSEWRTAPAPLEMRTGELFSVFTFYICPRPVVLVSVVDGSAGNMFPMDLIGPVGTRHYALGLHNGSAPLRLMEQSRRIALSTVPLDRSSLALELGKNHNAAAVDFGSLPFATIASTAFGLPVPQFSLRVREMKIETTRRLESHTLFLATTITDELRSEGLQMFQIHGLYQAWRHQRQIRS